MGQGFEFAAIRKQAVDDRRKSMMRWMVALAIWMPFAAGAQTVRTEEHQFRVVKVVEGLDHPWSVAFLPDGRMLVTERPGRLRVVSKEGKPEPKAVQGLPPVAEYGQGGLHDVVLHPRFAENQLVYIAYAARWGDGVGTELARGRFTG